MNEEHKIRANILTESSPIRANVSQLETVTQATETKKGSIRIATEEEALEGTSNNTAITPKTLNTVTSTNNASINARIESLENAEDSEMEDIITLIQTRTNNMIQFND